jgi:gamma-glutamyltranspeptidase/glutathione hydrolase
MGFLSADSLHTQIEATRLAFADRAQFYGDPAFTGFDTRNLLTDEYTAQRRAMISNDRAMPPPPHAELRIDGDTTYLTTADSDGMMVSLIQSNYRGMGSGLVPDGLGFMLQDRAEFFRYRAAIRTSTRRAVARSKRSSLRSRCATASPGFRSA